MSNPTDPPALSWRDGEPPRDITKQYIAMVTDPTLPDNAPIWGVIQWSTWRGGTPFWEWSGSGNPPVEVIKYAELPELDWIGKAAVQIATAWPRRAANEDRPRGN